MQRFNKCFVMMLVITMGPSAFAAEEAKVQVVFCAMGDVPYAPKEDLLLPKQIADLPNDAEFVVHVGDI